MNMAKSIRRGASRAPSSRPAGAVRSKPPVNSVDWSRVCSAAPGAAEYIRQRERFRRSVLRSTTNSKVLTRCSSGGPARLRMGGQMIVLAYHSLEDRPVKLRFRELVRDGSFAALTRKALRPSDLESAENPRARSARLRCIERGCRNDPPHAPVGAAIEDRSGAARPPPSLQPASPSLWFALRLLRRATGFPLCGWRSATSRHRTNGSSSKPHGSNHISGCARSHRNLASPRRLRDTW